MTSGANEDQISEFMAAGARSLRFNAPLGDERAQGMIAWLVAVQAATVVDLGCGRGGFLRGLVERSPGVRAMGVDTDPEAIADARMLADGLSVGLLFEVGDVRSFGGTAHAAICIGASHAFDDSATMMSALAEVAPIAVVGDAIWQSDPDEWCRETFGNLPTGLGDLADLAEAAGWTVDQAEVSSDEEWETFERQWGDNIRNLRSPEAEAFAARRASEFERYRGTLGFGWLLLHRAAPTS